MSSMGEIMQSDAMPVNQENREVVYTQIEDCPGAYDEYFFDGAHWLLKNPPPLTVSELKKIGKPYLLNGIKYQVPLDKDAQDTVSAIQVQYITGIILNDPNLKIDTVMQFSNGTDMPITNPDWLAFATWFRENRRQFFRILDEI